MISRTLIKIKRKIKDKRGSIEELINEKTKSVSLISTKKGSIRANHYHKTDWHYIYVLKGSFVYFYRERNKSKIYKTLVKKNQLLFTPPLLDHATYHTEYTEMLVVSKNKRDKKTYERDTVRVKFIDIKKVNELKKNL
jgi:dTDP-4-dehydrorhamnose 3,5-epimerase-like enzyme